MHHSGHSPFTFSLFTIHPSLFTFHPSLFTLMDFRLTFPISPLQPALEYRDPLLLLGSCFAEEMGEKLQEHLFPALVNPHGILYNPLSIANAVHSYLDQKQYTEADLFMHND